MTNAEFKIKLLQTGLFQSVSRSGQYVCKTCPYCGDMKKHMYVLIRQDDDSPVLYNCFKCNAHGIINQEFLDYFGIENIDVPKIKGKRRIQPNDVSVLVNLINEETDCDMIHMCSKYIEHRVGVYPSIDDLKAFQVIGNPYGYVEAYLGGDMRGLKDRVWFRLHNGNMIGRHIDDNVESRWKKRNYMGGQNYVSGGIYIIKNTVDTHQIINICICEGVMDAIGLYYHGNVPNSVFIACMGSDYAVGMKYALNMGIFGDSVSVRVYKDADVSRMQLPKSYTNLFKSITVYHNTLAKDYGVRKEQIEIEKYSQSYEKGVCYK
jgi:hypothetical protein